MAVGGAAYLVSKAIKTAKVVGFADLGMEAIYEFDVVDMPVTVAVDSGGTSAHITGPAEWQKRIASGEFKASRSPPLDQASHPVGVFRQLALEDSASSRPCAPSCRPRNFVYVADSGHAPYGERDAVHVIGRSQAITRHLLAQHHIKALVVACNTATAAAIHLLRQQYPELPIVGVEPGAQAGRAAEPDPARRRHGHARHAGKRQVPRPARCTAGPG